MNINPIKWYKNRQFEKRLAEYKSLMFRWNMKYILGLPPNIIEGTEPGEIKEVIVSCTICKQRVNGKENKCACKPQCDW